MISLGQISNKSLTAINSLSLRERSLLLLVLCLVMAILWQTRIYQPMSNRQMVIEKQLNIARKTNATLQSLRDKAQQSADQGPQGQAHRRILELEEANRQLNGKLAQAGIVPIQSQEIVNIEKKLLAQQAGLKFHKIERLPVEPNNQEETAFTNRSRKKQRPARLYRHPMVIQWLGSYTETWHYLKNLESANLPIRWERLHYQSNMAPEGLLTLQISTITLYE
jgi:hypothetical protein